MEKDTVIEGNNISCIISPRGEHGVYLVSLMGKSKKVGKIKNNLKELGEEGGTGWDPKRKWIIYNYIIKSEKKALLNKIKEWVKKI